MSCPAEQLVLAYFARSLIHGVSQTYDQGVLNFKSAAFCSFIHVLFHHIFLQTQFILTPVFFYVRQARSVQGEAIVAW